MKRAYNKLCRKGIVLTNTLYINIPANPRTSNKLVACYFRVEETHRRRDVDWRSILEQQLDHFNVILFAGDVQRGHSILNMLTTTAPRHRHCQVSTACI